MFCAFVGLLSLKGNSASCGHWSVFLKVLQSNNAYVKQVVFSLLWLQRKLYVIWLIASSNVTRWLSCIMGNVGFEKQSNVLLCTPTQHCWTHYGQFKLIIFFFLLKTCRIHYPQCNSASEWNRWSQITCSFLLEPQKYTTFYHICSSPPQDL